MKFLLTHVEHGKAKDLPHPVQGAAITDMLKKLLDANVVESVHIAVANSDDEIIFVKG